MDQLESGIRALDVELDDATLARLDELDEPVMRYYLGSEMAGDSTNYWAPNKLCLERMFREFGFTRFEFTPNPFVEQTSKRGRLFMHAWRN